MRTTAHSTSSCGYLPRLGTRCYFAKLRHATREPIYILELNENCTVRSVYFQILTFALSQTYTRWIKPVKVAYNAPRKKKIANTAWMKMLKSLNRFAIYSEYEIFKLSNNKTGSFFALWSICYFSREVQKKRLSFESDQFVSFRGVCRLVRPISARRRNEFLGTVGVKPLKPFVLYVCGYSKYLSIGEEKIFIKKKVRYISAH